jgi:hypothetical protein
MSKTVLGIDIGKAGYFAVLTPDGGIDTTPMPKIGTEVDYHMIRTLIAPLQHEPCIVVFERLTSLHLASKKANWSLSNQAGTVRGIIIGLNLPFQEIAPKLWQEEMLRGIPEIKDSKNKRDTKKMALIAVQRLLPEQNLLRTEKCTKPDDGLVDAILLATYAKRMNL